MIHTILIYNSLLFLSTFASQISKFASIKAKGILNIFTFLLLSAVAGFRSGVGSDYEAYVSIFYNIDSFTFFRIEPLYYLLNQILKYLGFQAQSVFIVMGMIAAYFAVKSSNKVSHPGIFIFSYITLIYLNSLNAVRQEIATTILLFAILLLVEGHSKKFIFLVLFATGFHYISIVFLPFVFINKINYTKKTMVLILLLGLVFIRFGILELLISTGILSGTKYSFYLYSDMYNGTTGTSLTSIFVLISKHFSLLIPFFISKKMISPELFKFRNATLILNSCLLLSIIMSLDLYILHRLVSLFTIANIFSIILLLESKLKTKQIWGLVTIVLMLFYFENDIRISQKNLPGKGITPYVTIFEKN